MRLIVDNHKKCTGLFLLVLALGICAVSCTKEPRITLNRDYALFLPSYEGEDPYESVVYLSSRGDWKAETDEEWFWITPKSGGTGDNQTLIISVTDYPKYENRSGTVTITSGKDVLTLTVHQYFKAIIKLSEGVIECDNKGLDIDIEAETNFTTGFGYLYGEFVDWVKVKKRDLTGVALSEGMKSKSIISVHVDENKTGEDRMLGIILGRNSSGIFESTPQIELNEWLFIKQSK